MPVDAAEFTAAMRQHATGVCLLTVRDGIDDVGTTVSAVMSVSASPPLLAVGLAAGGYPAEVLGEVGSLRGDRAGRRARDRRQPVRLGRSPVARHLLESVPWRAAPHSDAIYLRAASRRWTAGSTGWSMPATTRWRCSPCRRYRSRVQEGAPLVRLRGRFADESGGRLGRG